MRAYIVRTKRKLDPFCEHPQECLIKNKTLKRIQQEILQSLGFESIHNISRSALDILSLENLDDFIVLDDRLFFSKELLKDFIKKSRAQRNSTVCALKSGLTTYRTITATQEIVVNPVYVEYPLYYFPTRKFRRKVQLLVIEPDFSQISMNVPGHICENKKYLIPITDKFIIRIDHWANLWAANLIALLSEIARLKKMSILKLSFLILKAHSFNQWKILSRMNRIGSNCDIHPTAYIEASTIGDNVVIGAGTVIRESIIGNNSFIGNGVVIEESAIGENNTILNGHILYSVLYPGVFSVSHMISASIIGRNGFMGSSVVLTDFRLDGKHITVMENGRKIDTKNRFLGCCLGHGVYLGAGCVVAPGRSIPNDMRIALKETVRGDSPENMSGFRLISKTKARVYPYKRVRDKKKVVG